MTAIEKPTDRWRPAWTLAAVAIVLLVTINVFTWWIELTDSIDGDVLESEPAIAVWRDYYGTEFTADSVLFVITALVVALILYRDRANRFAWILGGSFVLIPIVMNPLTTVAVLSQSGQLPTELTPWIAAGLAPIFLMLGTSFVLVIATFPTGHFVAGRFGRLLRTSLVIWAAIGVAVVFRAGPSFDAGSTAPYTFDNPLGIEWLRWLDTAIVDAMLGVLFIMAFASLALRYMRADSEVRHQIKWVITAMAFLLVGWAIAVNGADTSWGGYALTVGGSLVVLSVAAAITKYRLYDIDLVINKAIVFAGLAAFITAIYVVVVVGIGSAFGGSDLGLSIAATALVAVAFEPVRIRLQRWANRLVYGSRATPYEVLSDLTGRLAATESVDGLLDRMAQRLSEGTGADRAIVWLANGSGFHAAAVAPSTEETPLRSATFDELPGSSVLIEHDGQRLGALSVEKARGDALTHTELQLMDDLAGSAGLVVQRRRLDEALTTKAAQLQESRRRLVDAQDVERRRLERDLHDGAQQQVVALKVKLGIAAQLAAKEGSQQTGTLIEQMADDAQGAIEQIRSLARGIYPPLLEADGLEAAIRALATQSPLDVRVHTAVRGRHPLALEGAIYFCVSEALTNAAKHAEGPVDVGVSDANGVLSFSVTDSGPGFDPTAVDRGAGLNNMADRLGALGGSVTIDSQPGHPTRVSGSLPVLAVDHALKRPIAASRLRA